MQNTGYSQVLRSTWFGREDEKTIRSWILSGQLHGEGKTRRRDTASSQVNLILTRRQDFGSCQVNFTMMKRRDTWYRHVDFIRTRRWEDKIMDLVMSTSWGWEDIILILSSRLHQDEKTTRYDPRSRQVDLIRTRIENLIFLSSIPHEVYLTRSRILSSCLLVQIKSTWRDPVSCLLVLIKSTWRDRLSSACLVFLSSHLVSSWAE